jgi:hypothetical protein
MDTQKQIESKLRETQAMETIAESLRSIAINFATMVSIVEADLKEEQAFRLVNERLKINTY